MTSQEKWREIRYQQDLGARGFTTGAADNYQSYKDVYAPQIARDQQYDAAIRSSFDRVSSPTVDVGWSSNPGPASSSPPTGDAVPHGSVGGGSFSGADYPAPRIVVAIRIMLALVVLGGVGGGLWAWASDDPYPIATGFSTAWLVVRVYISIILFVISQLMLVGVEVLRCGHL